MLNLLFRNLCVCFCASIYDTNGNFFSLCISAAEHKNPLQITHKQDERFHNSLVEHNRKQLLVPLFLLSHNLYQKKKKISYAGEYRERCRGDVEENKQLFLFFSRDSSKCHIKAIAGLIFTR